MIAKYACAAALLTLGLGSAAEAACQRHIYNPSASPWTFQAIPDTSPIKQQLGNVWFSGIRCAQKKNGPCTVPPGATATIKYTTTNGVSAGAMVIRDSNGEQRGFTYHGNFSNCPYINHSGNTGAVSVNAPANGDYSIGANDW